MKEHVRAGWVSSGNRPVLRRWLWPLLLLLVTAFVAPLVQAHASGLLQISNQPIGPYETSVWTVPDPLQAEMESHVTLVLLEPAEPGQTQQAFITDESITVRAHPSDGGEPLLETEAILGADPDYPLFYEGEIFFPEGGEWEIEVVLGNGAARTFTADVLPAPGSGVPWLPLFGVGVIVVGALLTLVMRLRSRESASDG